MEQKTVEVSMQLIAISGEARGKALLALKKAKQGDFIKAKSLASEAKQTILDAHRIHADIIAREASGENWDIKTLFIHSQDHFTAGLVICDLVDHILYLYEK